MVFYNFRLRGMFCVINFSSHKHEFSELNSALSIRVFAGSARDALKKGDPQGGGGAWGEGKHLATALATVRDTSRC
jgi:hypothetical protein